MKILHLTYKRDHKIQLGPVGINIVLVANSVTNANVTNTRNQLWKTLRQKNFQKLQLH